MSDEFNAIETQLSPSAQPQRRLSWTGIGFLVCGLAMIVFELLTGFMGRRLANWAHWTTLAFGGVFAGWGLKEIVTSLSPRLWGRAHHLRLPPEGAVYLGMLSLLFVGAMYNRNNLLMLVFSAMIGPFIINGWYTFTMLRRLRVNRHAPERVMAGETFGVVLELENRKSWLSIWLVTVRDTVTQASGILLPQVLFARVPGSSTRRGHYHLCLNERGRYQLGPCEVSTRFPLGLEERGVGADVRQELRVYPRLGRLRGSWRRHVLYSTELVTQLRPANGPFRDEMHRLREFRPGDDPRLIHWRTSARMNELMVCEFQESRDRNLNLILDAWLPARPSTEDRQGLERGLRFAITICMEFLQSSRQSSLAVTLLGRDPLHWHGDAGDHSAGTLLDGFALLQPTFGGNLGHLTKEIDPERTRSLRTLVVTTRPELVRSSLHELLNGHASDLLVYGTTQAELAPLFDEE